MYDTNQEYDLTVYTYLKDSGLGAIYTTVRQDETQIRCPFCGDSIKSSLSAHLYIKNQAPFPYYCQRCSTSGIVNNDFLNKIDKYDGEIVRYLNEAQANYSKTLLYKYGTNASLFSKKKLIFPPNEYTDKELKKLEYIEGRIGQENLFTHEEDLKKFNIVLNLTDFLTNNKFDINSYQVFQKSKLNDLDQHYAMFLLNDKIMVNARHIKPMNKKEKFYKFRIINDESAQTRRFYNINVPLDLSNRVFNIHLTEGIFDILSLYTNNIIDSENKARNNIYIANNGKGYLFILNYLQSLGILNCNINIYSDNDVSIKELKKRLRWNTISKYNGVNVYYNKYYERDSSVKDFGVPKDKIILGKPIPLRF